MTTASPQTAPEHFPARILDLLREVADRKGTPTRGPWEDGNGEPLQDDADAAIAWIQSAQAIRRAPISTAPKDGAVVLVNDTSGNAPWAAAKWVSSPEWSGWVYDDELLNDANPLGPQPTIWYEGLHAQS